MDGTRRNINKKFYLEFDYKQFFLSEIESDSSIFTLIIVIYFSEFSYDSMKFDMISFIVIAACWRLVQNLDTSLRFLKRISTHRSIKCLYKGRVKKMKICK